MNNIHIPASRTQATDINQALANLVPHKTAQYLNEMLDNVQATRIGWLGSHLISFRGYSGEAPIESIISIFFKFAQKDTRLQYRIYKICGDFDREQSNYILGTLMQTATQKFEQIQCESNNNKNNFKK